jgi:hypothetical protein
MEFTAQQITNFWSRVEQKGANDCWPWTGSRRRARPGQMGYGQVHIHRRNYPAHRIAYMMVTGRDLTPDCKVRHTCDNPICCNPAHLVEGTHLENMEDMRRRGRGGKKLTPAIAREIRKAQGTGTQRQVADRFGVSHRTIGHIWNCQSWEFV